MVKTTNIPRTAALSLDHLNQGIVSFTEIFPQPYFYTSEETQSVCATEMSSLEITFYLAFN